MSTIFPMPIFLHEEKKCIIQEGIRYYEEIPLTLKGFGILFLVAVLWFVGLAVAIFFTEEKFDNPLIGIFGYLILTALLLIFLG